MTSNPIPESLAEPARLWSISRLSALPIAAVAGMMLAQIAVYGSTLQYAVRIRSGHPLHKVFILAPDLGMALAAIALPPLILLIRSCGGGSLFRRIAAALPLAGLFAVCLALCLPWNSVWEFGNLHVFLATIGRRGIIACGTAMLFFAVIPKGKRGLWYGCAVSAGFLWWTLLLFYVANGCMQARLLSAWADMENTNRNLWQMHALCILACPLYGLFLDRARDGAKKLMTICSVFLMLAPTLNALTASPAVYSIILSLGTLAQFAMTVTVVIAVAECGGSMAWVGWACCLQVAFRSVSMFISLILREMPGFDGGIPTLLATAAALAFFVAARRWDDGTAAAASPTDSHDADTPAEKYALEQFLDHPSLSPREREVAALWLTGKGNKEVAMALYISESTVKTHIRNILSKLGAPNRTELLLRIIDPPSATPSMTNDLSCNHPKG